MQPNLNDIRLAEEHRHNLLREAEQLRQEAELAAANALRPRRRPFYAPALARLGRTLAIWGAQLQAIDAPR